MSKQPIKNIGASVRARLLALSPERNQTFQLMLTNYVLERLLYRLSQTEHRSRFILKGAMLLTKWFDDILCVRLNGVVFDVDGVQIDRIREELEYGGLRIKTNATVDTARVRVMIDIGFGDAVEPGLTEMDLPVMLDFPAPHLRAYARETVIAEKFQAMVFLGRANSRMKDFYDIWVLSRASEFGDDRLAGAIAATFARRKMDVPDALTPAFAADAGKVQQWNAFVANVAFQPVTLAEVTRDLAAFLMPHAAAARSI